MVNSDEKAIIAKIIQLRKSFAGARGKSRFAKAIGISASTYNYYENDRLPPIPVLLKICEVTGTDLHWLLTGHSNQQQDAPHLSRELIKKLNTFLLTSPESEAAIIAFIELLNEKKTLEKGLSSKTPEPKLQRPGWIPILGRTAAGMVHFWEKTGLPEPKDAIIELDLLVEKYTGRTFVASESGDIAVDLQVAPLIREMKTRRANLIQVGSYENDYGTDQIVQFIECQEIHKLFPDAFALQIDGDSMAPRINDTDIVILDPLSRQLKGMSLSQEFADQIGVTCKLIRTTESQVHLIPINERYETKTVPKENLLWALAVLCHIKI